MPVRGTRSIYPAAPKKPTGMFKQPQKMDSTAGMPHKDVMQYAKGSSTRSKPKGGGGQSLRHQKPKGH